MLPCREIAAFIFETLNMSSMERYMKDWSTHIPAPGVIDKAGRVLSDVTCSCFVIKHRICFFQSFGEEAILHVPCDGKS